MSSLSRARVIQIEEVNKHPNADTLDITSVDGFPLVIKKDRYKAGDLAVYVPFDMITSDEPEFDWCPNQRIKGVKLRGILSVGILVDPRPHHKLGDDVTEELRVVPYEPKQVGEKISFGKAYDDADSPSGEVKYTDIESLRKYHSLFTIGEEVVINEKIHGANFRAVYQDGKLHIGTRTRWIKGDNIWTRAAAKYDLENKLNAFPNYIFFGEVYGQVQDLKYDHEKGDVSLVFFDVFEIKQSKHLNFNEFVFLLYGLDLPIAPILYRGEWKGLEEMKYLGDGKSVLGNNIKEGFVVRPIEERYDYSVGRVILKYHSDAYLGRK